MTSIYFRQMINGSTKRIFCLCSTHLPFEFIAVFVFVLLVRIESIILVHHALDWHNAFIETCHFTDICCHSNAKSHSKRIEENQLWLSNVLVNLNGISVRVLHYIRTAERINIINVEKYNCRIIKHFAEGTLSSVRK